MHTCGDFCLELKLCNRKAVLFLPGSFGHLGFACEHKPAALLHGVNQDEERRLSSLINSDESRCRYTACACCAPFEGIADDECIHSPFRDVLHIGVCCCQQFSEYTSISGLLYQCCLFTGMPSSSGARPCPQLLNSKPHPAPGWLGWNDSRKIMYCVHHACD